MGFDNVGEYVAAINGGASVVSNFRKVPSQASAAGQWVDLSMAGGNPPPQYYAAEPRAFAVLNGLRGIYHGGAVSPYSKVLTHLELVTPTAGFVGQVKLVDIVGYYPFIDLDDAGVQTMDNTVTLPRYTTGDGVMAMLVAQAPTVGAGNFTFTYVNQSGVTQTSATISCVTVAQSIASLVTHESATVAANGPFLPLVGGDTGIRSVTSLTMGTLNGGLAALVLVKPLADTMIYEASTPNEKEWVSQISGPPTIPDGAYLSLIALCAGSVAAGFMVGRANFAWSAFQTA